MYMKRTSRRFISFCLVAAMLCGIIGFTFTDKASAADPFAQMKDEYLEYPHGSAGLQQEELPEAHTDADIVLSAEDPMMDEPLVAEDEDSGKTDRYIVKYKDNKESRFLGRIGGILESAEDIAPVVEADTGVFSIHAEEVAERSAALTASEKLVVDIPVEAVTTENVQLIVLNEKKSPSEFAEELKALGADKDIEYIQPDFELSLDSLGLEVIDGGTVRIDKEELKKPEKELVPPSEEPEEAETPEIADEIDVTVEAGRQVLVAVIDTGFDTGHEVFEGYLHADTPDTETDLLSYAHGTHVGGIIVDTVKDTGADVKLLPIKVFDNGNAYTSDIIAAIEYASASGAQIINCSFGSTAYNQALYDAIAASDALFVCAVGNNRRDFDVVPSYPAGYDLPNVISVASTNADDGFSYYSNYGSGSIDIAARGREVYSALPGNSYGKHTGTSMSAAYVTGAAALALSNAEMTALELKARILSSADRLSNLQNKVADGRRLNIVNAASGTDGSYLTLNPADDFDVHGYQRTEEENWQLFSSLEIVQVEAGANHTLALASDGTVWAWGNNVSGLLGGGTSAYRTSPVQVTGLVNITQIDANRTHSLALRSDGTVWSWGNNYYGQLGDGTTINRFTPVQVSGLSNVICVAAGYTHSLAVRMNGTVFAWGSNHAGQLDINKDIRRGLTPTQVENLAGIKSVAAGERHSLALKTDGTVWGWGSNYCVPAQINNLTGAIQIDIGNNNNLALKSDGTVWSWTGYGSYYQYVSGTVVCNNTAVQTGNISDVEQISAGSSFYLALKEDGNVWSWGNNSYGQLGDGTTTTRNTPSQVSEISNVKLVAAGENHSVAVLSDNTLWSWGRNDYGQLGDGTTTDQYLPVQVNLQGIEGGVIPSRLVFSQSEYAVSIGDTACNVTVAATAYDSENEEITSANITYSFVSAHLGSTIDSETGVVTLSPFVESGTIFVKAVCSGVEATAEIVITASETTVPKVKIAAGYHHTLAINTDGTVWAWGINNLGQLGDGTNANKTEPVQVEGLTNVVQVAAGYNHSLALKSDGTVWAWGYNSSGQLGDGTTARRITPVQVSGLSDIIHISSGMYHGLALKADGTVWAWGCNNYGQLGLGATGNKTTPVLVRGLTDVIQIAGGYYHSLALKADGTVWAWGYNSYGQLGDGTTIMRREPVSVIGVESVKTITSGYYHNVAILIDGSVWAWGVNSSGHLGDGTVFSEGVPVRVLGLSDIKHTDLGCNHSLAAGFDGTLWVWGYNGDGQLGDGTKINKYTPVHTIAFSGVIQVAGGFSHSVAVRYDNTVWSWGDNSYGKLGDGTRTNRLTPVQVNLPIPKDTGGDTPGDDGDDDIDAPDGPEVNVAVTADATVRIALTASDITSFSGATYTITYDAAKLLLSDAAAQTYGADITVGAIPGTGLTITNISAGETVLTLDKTIPSGKAWSGVITVLEFEVLASGTATVSVA